MSVYCFSDRMGFAPYRDDNESKRYPIVAL